MIDYPISNNMNSTLDIHGQLWFYPPYVGTKNTVYFTGDNPQRLANITGQIFWINGMVIDPSYDDLDCFLFGVRWFYTMGEYWWWGFAIPSSDKRYVGAHVLPNNKSLSCVFFCPAGYYITNIQNSWGVVLCGICHSSCYDCIGPNEEDCLTCRYKKDTLIQNTIRNTKGNGNCEDLRCLSNQYLKNNVCRNCNTNCDLCNELTCLSCSIGYYLKDSICIACPLNCQNCNSIGCLKCLIGNYNHTIVYKIDPYTPPIGYNGTLINPSTTTSYSCIPSFSTPLSFESILVTTTSTTTLTYTSTMLIDTTLYNSSTQYALQSTESIYNQDYSTTSIYTSTLLCNYTSSTLYHYRNNMTLYSTYQHYIADLISIKDITNNITYSINNTFYQSIVTTDCNTISYTDYEVSSTTLLNSIVVQSQSLIISTSTILYNQMDTSQMTGSVPISIIAILSVLSAFLLAFVIFIFIWATKSFEKYKRINAPVIIPTVINKNLESYKITPNLIRPMELLSQIGCYEWKSGKLMLGNDQSKTVLIKTIDKTCESLFIQEVELYAGLRGVYKIQTFLNFCETPKKNVILYEHYELSLNDWFLSPATNLLPLKDYQSQIKAMVPQIVQGMAALHAKKRFHGNMGLQAIYIKDLKSMNLCIGDIRLKSTISQLETDQPVYARYLNTRAISSIKKNISYTYNDTDDLFAFGMTVFELVHGEKAYLNLDIDTTVSKIESKEYPLYSMQLYDELYRKCLLMTTPFKDLMK